MAKTPSAIKIRKTPPPTFFRTNHDQNGVCDTELEAPLSLNPPVLVWPMAKMSSVIQNIRPPTHRRYRTSHDKNVVCVPERNTLQSPLIGTSHGQNVMCVLEYEDPLQTPVLGRAIARMSSVFQSMKRKPLPSTVKTSHAECRHHPLVLGRASSGMSSVIQNRRPSPPTCVRKSCGQNFVSYPQKKDHLSPPVLGRAIARMSSVIQCEKTPSTAMSALLQESPLSYLHLNKNRCDERLLYKRPKIR